MPLDPDYPVERLSVHVGGHCACPLVLLTQGHFAGIVWGS